MLRSICNTASPGLETLILPYRHEEQLLRIRAPGVQSIYSGDVILVHQGTQCRRNHHNLYDQIGGNRFDTSTTMENT
jgi:hypothetical protein